MIKKFIIVEIFEERFLTSVELNNHYNNMEINDLNIKTNDKNIIVGSYDNKFYDDEIIALQEVKRLLSIEENIGNTYTVLQIYTNE